MRKFRRSSLLFAIILILANTVPLYSFSEDNDNSDSVLLESTFENASYDGWSAFGGSSKVKLNTEKSHSGSYSLSTSEREKSWSGPAITITELINPGEDISFQAYAISEVDEPITIQVTVKTIDSNGTEDFKSVASLEINNTEWSRIEGSYSSEGTISEAILYVETISGTADFCIDDVKITGAHAMTSTENDYSPNYNFGFEDGLKGWITRGSMSLSTSDKFSYKGRCSLYAYDRVDFWNAPMIRVSHLLPGVDYNYSAYVMYNGKEYEDSHLFQLKLQYIMNGEEVYSKIADKMLQKGTWSNISGNFTLPEGAVDVFLYIQPEDVNVNEEDVTINDLLSFYIDDVTITDSTKKNTQRNIATIITFIGSIAAVTLLIFMLIFILRRSRNRKAALRSACIDAMTNTYNRNTFETRINSLEESPEKAKKVYISVCDVNFLKYINDNYGHENGDKAIIRCATALLKSIGKNGKVYRTGGDEFVCICDIDKTNEIKTELSIETGKYKGYPFAVAVGTASYDKKLDGNSPDIKVIFARADKEMYKDKQEIKKNNKDFTALK